MSARSYLYVPGDRPDRFERAKASGADAVVFDLEDAVSTDNKAMALEGVLDVLAGWESDAEAWVRINQGDRGESELHALVEQVGLIGVFVPKSTAAVISAVGEVLSRHPRAGAPSLAVCALVESAVGVQDLPVMARLSVVALMAMGEIDLAADLGIVLEDGDVDLWPLRLSAVVACASAKIAGPIGPVWTDLNDLGGLRGAVRTLRRNGFGAMQAIHPAQVSVINEQMMPSADEYERASQLLSLATSGSAFADGKGQMIDEAVLRTARATVMRFDSYRA